MKTPTLRTKLADAPDDITREIIRLLRKLKKSQTELQKTINSYETDK